MPYKSKKQRAYIHAQAERGEPWAKKFVAEADRMKQPRRLRTSHTKRRGGR